MPTLGRKEGRLRILLTTFSGYKKVGTDIFQISSHRKVIILTLWKQKWQLLGVKKSVILFGFTTTTKRTNKRKQALMKLKSARKLGYVKQSKQAVRENFVFR